MATIKSYTDLEQSKKLAKILPIESADMYMYWFYSGKRYYIESMDNGDFNEERDIRVWSLAALLGALPQSITKYIESERCQKTFHLNLFRAYYYCVSYSFSPSISDDDGDNTLYGFGRDNWVDACVDMIEKLHELKML